MPTLPSRLQQIADHPETKRFGKFALVGVSNTIIDFGLFVLLTRVFHVQYLWANFFAYLIATGNSYIINRRWTFRSTAGDWHREMVQYFIVIGIGFLINEGLLYILVDHLHLLTIVAKALVIGVVVIWNYGANRMWTFRKSLST